MDRLFKAKVKCSMHSELPPGTELTSNEVIDELGYKWMKVKLSNGIDRDVIVSDVTSI